MMCHPANPAGVRGPAGRDLSPYAGEPPVLVRAARQSPPGCAGRAALRAGEGKWRYCSLAGTSAI